ncbi:MAG: hypothetical protein ACRC5T_03830 [Cetobacterium sp.]
MILIMLVYYIFTIIFHILSTVYYCLKVKKSSCKENSLKINTIIKKIICLIISPDYISAKICKKMNGSRKNKIKEWNRNNIILGFIVIAVILVLEFSNTNILRDSFRMKFALVFWAYRTISRSFEIMFAFYKDVTKDPEKNDSKLLKFERIKLAVISYFEIILNFGILYYLIYNAKPNIPLFNFFNWICPDIQSLICGSGFNPKIIPFVMSSLFISTGTKVVGINPFFILQLVTSLCLVIFAIAGYMGDVKGKE